MINFFVKRESGARNRKALLMAEKQNLANQLF